MEIVFPTHELYLIGWKYLMAIGAGFSCDRDANTIWLDRTDDLAEDAYTKHRLYEIIKE